ncbi:MAG: hypothetical protein KTR27_18445 [Leptolyngbyaceae cyanobacterium MAG.088]|nr:hypothetical protein [Leptolyngbyaceae cyanobacterium MAG.088]
MGVAKDIHRLLDQNPWDEQRPDVFFSVDTALGASLSVIAFSPTYLRISNEASEATP